MIKKITMAFIFTITLLCNQSIVATSSGKLFNVVGSGSAVDKIDYTLCLNGKGPLSCQNYATTSSVLSINSTIPNHTYLNAGIKFNSSAYTPSNCAPYSNGYCLFSVSSTIPALIDLGAKAYKYLYVTNITVNTISQYDAASGAVINPVFISGLNGPATIAIDEMNNLYVLNAQNHSIGKYDATTGVMINPNFISALDPRALFFALDAEGDIYVSNDSLGTVVKYDGKTGNILNANFVSGLNEPSGLAFDEAGNLYIANNATLGTIGKYDGKSGAVINAAFISGLENGPYSISIDLIGNLYLGSIGSGITGSISKYSGVTGEVINAELIYLGILVQLAFNAEGNLFIPVASGISGPSNIAEYNAITGALINGTFISGQYLSYGLAFK